MGCRIAYKDGTVLMITHHQFLQVLEQPVEIEHKGKSVLHTFKESNVVLSSDMSNGDIVLYRLENNIWSCLGVKVLVGVSSVRGTKVVKCFGYDSDGNFCFSRGAVETDSSELFQLQ